MLLNQNWIDNDVNINKLNKGFKKESVKLE